MMVVPFFQVDAFATARFRGNPAAVMVMGDLDDSALLQLIAAENNLAETAFLWRQGEDFRIRWFTPKIEVSLCGHATLASAAVVMERLEPGRTAVTFHSASGLLSVSRRDEAYVLDFPTRPSQVVEAPAGLAEALGCKPIEVADDSFSYIALLESAEAVRSLAPNLDLIRRLDRGGVIVTAGGDSGFDIVSRYFAPKKGVDEDPVTGSAHCALAPYWSERLGKTDLLAYQASARGGEIRCRLRGNRVELEGHCILFIEGKASL